MVNSNARWRILKGPVAGVVLLSLISGCSSTPEEGAEQAGTTGEARSGRAAALQQYGEEEAVRPAEEQQDPLESINRAFWYLNYDLLDKYIYRPVTRVYINYVPEFAKEGINNMVLNLDEPSSTVNHLLLGDGVQSGRALVRFMVNSSVGLLGFFDVANALGVSRDQLEFGDVLARLGAGEGAYLMVPALGPSTVLNEVGDFVDRAYFPYSYFNLTLSLVRLTADGLYQRASVVNQEPLLDSALDPYIFVRDGYLQYRDHTTGRKKEETQQDDEYLNEYLDELD